MILRGGKAKWDFTKERHFSLSIQPLNFKSLQAFIFGRKLHQNQPISGNGVMRVPIHLVPV